MMCSINNYSNEILTSFDTINEFSNPCNVNKYARICLIIVTIVFSGVAVFLFN